MTDYQKEVQRLVDARDAGALRTMLKDQDYHARMWAAHGLGRLRDAGAVDDLIAALQDGEDAVITCAATALGEIGDPKAAPALSRAMYFNPTLKGHFVQRHQEPAAEALVKLGPAAVEPLAEIMRGKIDDLRQRAAGVLGRIADPKAVPALVAALKEDLPLPLRLAVLDALSRIQDPGVVAPMLDVLSSGSKPAAFKQWKLAAKGLDKQGWQSNNDAIAAAYWLAKDDLDRCVAVGAAAVPRLMAVLQDEDAVVSAARCLGRIGDPRAVSALKDRLRHCDASYMREAVQAALAQLGS